MKETADKGNSKDACLIAIMCVRVDLTLRDSSKRSGGENLVGLHTGQCVCVHVCVYVYVCVCVCVRALVCIFAFDACLCQIEKKSKLNPPNAGACSSCSFLWSFFCFLHLLKEGC